MLRPHTIGELEGTDPPLSPENEADLLQADIMEWFTEVAMSGFSLNSSKKEKVALAVATFWSQRPSDGGQSFAEQFRIKCCDGVRLKAALHEELQPLSNGSRINAVLSHLGLANLATFFSTHIEALKRMLLEQGIDVDCVEGSHRVVN